MSISQLKQLMTQNRWAGYAIKDEEGEIGCRRVGAPVFDHSGSGIPAISVAGTTAQIRREEFTDFGQLARQTAADISVALCLSRPGSNPQRSDLVRKIAPSEWRYSLLDKLPSQLSNLIDNALRLP